MKRILIVEDDETLRNGLTMALQSEDILTQSAPSLTEARQMLREHTIDLILLDCNLPDGNGLTLCQEFSPQIPVIFLTVRDGEMDEVAAFRVGASDYVKKPFSLTVLQERIAVVLRKITSSYLYEDGSFRFDFSELAFFADGKRIMLSATEQKLLHIFCTHRGQILERQALVDKVWSCQEEYIDENALSVVVKRLRDKLGTDCIGTVYGLGYVWKGGIK